MTISVIIPVYNAAAHLQLCLGHLRNSTVAPLECLVVDDGSTDETATVAREAGARVINVPSRRGPAFARNLGASEARGDILFFLDADVCVRPDAIARLLANFRQDPDLDAVVGSYDDSPAPTGLLSQYRNLMHSHVHQRAPRNTATFWSGCGAIRRLVFLAHEGFDASYSRPAIEDIELGYRLARANCKLAIDNQLLVKHLKHWTFWKLIKTDVLDRGVPWTELILRDGSMPNHLNIDVSERISVALAFILFGLAAEGTIRYRGYFLTPFLAVLVFLLAKYWVDATSRPRSRAITAAMTLLIASFSWLSWHYHMIKMVPPVLLGYVILFVQHRYTYGRTSALMGKIYGIYVFFVLIFALAFLPARPVVFIVYLVLLGLVVINKQFYVFLSTRLGGFSALAVLPFHFLYHFYNGISFLIGLSRHIGKGLFQGTHRGSRSFPASESSQRARQYVDRS